MFYEPGKNDPGLPFNPFKACVVPRPIAWISTLSPDGVVNLAPFSIANQLAYDPPFVFFSGAGVLDDGQVLARPKDSVANAESTGEFVWNMATYDLRSKVNASSSPCPPDQDEMEMVGLTAAPSTLVRPPRVLESPISLECTFHASLTLPADRHAAVHHVVIGRVVGIHIAEWALTDGRVDFLKIRPLSRLGYMDYTSVTDVFEIPVDPELVSGMIGAPDD